MKRVIIYGGILLAILAIAISSIFYAVSLNRQVSEITLKNSKLISDLNKEKTNFTELEVSIDALDEELDGANHQFQELETDVEDYQEEIVSLEKSLGETEEELSSTQSEFNDLTDKYNELHDLYGKNVRRISSLEKEAEKYICDESLNMDYSGIAASSERLMDFYARQSHVEHVRYAYRDHIWTNTDTKIHSIRYIENDGEEHVDHFLVFVNEFGMKEGTFWLSKQCWLDPP